VRSQVHGQTGSVASEKGAFVLEQTSFLLEKSVKVKRNIFVWGKKYLTNVAYGWRQKSVLVITA
jgi:hypothetical protein